MDNSYYYEAYNVLFKVFSKGAYAQIELNNALSNQKEYSALITKIVYGVIEKNIELEYIINSLTEKKPKLPIGVLLKMGIYSILHLDSIPDYAICNGIVELTKQLGKTGAAGFVNAVLKKVCIQREFYATNTKNVQNDAEYLSLKYNYPKWIVEKLLKKYSHDFLCKILDKVPTKTHIRVNRKKISTSEFEKILNANKIKFEKSYITGGYYVNYAQIQNVTDINSLYTVQSAGSMLVCQAANVFKGATLLDVCAAPGGKSVYLNELGAKVEAWDIHEHRVSLINSYADRMGAKITTKTKDATIFDNEYENKFDYVLCDVPCSGLGVTGKKSDILLKRKQEDIDELVILQAQILLAASKYVKIGGYIVYSTCTFLSEENEDIVNNFLKQNLNFQPENIKFGSEVSFKPQKIEYNELRAEPFLQIYPRIDDSEGFFMARLKRVW